MPLTATVKFFDEDEGTSVIVPDRDTHESAPQEFSPMPTPRGPSTTGIRPPRLRVRRDVSGRS
jgi:hypothetical protein